MMIELMKYVNLYSGMPSLNKYIPKQTVIKLFNINYIIKNKFLGSPII